MESQKPYYSVIQSWHPAHSRIATRRQPNLISCDSLGSAKDVLPAANPIWEGYKTMEFSLRKEKEKNNDKAWFMQLWTTHATFVLLTEPWFFGAEYRLSIAISR